MQKHAKTGRFRSSFLPRTPIPKAVLVKREEYLHDVPLPKLEAMHRREPPGKSRDRLQAAVLRKRGKTVEKIAGIVGRHSSTVHRWLYRMEHEQVPRP